MAVKEKRFQKNQSIDFQTHAFPAEHSRKMAKYYPEECVIRKDDQGREYLYAIGTPFPDWDYNKRIEVMDEYGVAIEILTNPLTYLHVDEHSPELCRLLNESYAEICRQNPKRFKAFATLPFNRMSDALAEMDHALSLPGFVGVFLNSNIGDRYLHTPDFFPFWAEVARRGVPVYMHPKACPGYQDEEFPPLLAFPADTTLSTTKLLYSGLFERHPDLILILSHLGGSLPYLARRIDLGFDVPELGKNYHNIPRRPSEYMPKLYFDTALGWHKPAFECAQALVGIEHLVFGSDHFMDTPAGSQYTLWTNEFLESLDLSESDKEKIYRGNALRILTM